MTTAILNERKKYNINEKLYKVFFLKKDILLLVILTPFSMKIGWHSDISLKGNLLLYLT